GRARLYFKSALSPDFYYVEMVPGPAGYTTSLPKPMLPASPITYYATVVAKDLTESRTPDVVAIIVEKKEDCGDKPVAGIAPAGPTAVFSTAGVAIAPAGFAAAGVGLSALG